MEYRHYYLAKNFINLAYHVTIISATQSHLFKTSPINNKSYNHENIDGIDYVWISVPKYKNSKDKIRIIKWFVFCLKLYFLPFKKMTKPDSIIMSSAAPFAIFPSIYLRNKFNAKLVFEVKDIWPLSLINVGGFSEKHPFIKLMAYAEQTAIKKCDFLVSNLPNYKKHITTLGINKKVYWHPNGINLKDFSLLPLPNIIQKQIPKNKFIIGYTGTIGQANAMQYFIESAILLKENTNIHFVIVGDGLEKNNFKKQCSSNNLSNVSFIDSIEKKWIPSMLETFDVCYIGWNKEPLYEFGIAANKIFDYMLSAKPILHSYSGKGDIIALAKCGITVEAENTNEIVKGLLKMYNLPKEKRKILGKNGKKNVLSNFSYSEISKNYIQTMFPIK